LSAQIVKLEPAPGRVPPADLDAEAAVISAAMIDREAIASLRPVLRPVYFYADANRRIYQAILELDAAGQPADTVSVAGYLRDRGRLDQVGGAPYLGQLCDATPAVANVIAHASRIEAKWRLRQLISTCQTIAAEGYGDCGDPEALIERASASLRSIAASSATPERQPVTAADVLGEWSSAGPMVHEPTGIARLDELTGGGPVYGTRWYLSGAPDAGKTALLVQIAHVYAQRGVCVGLLAVDEEAGDLTSRVAQRLGYTRQHCELRDPLVLADMRAALTELPLRLYDASWTIEAAAANLAEHARTRGMRAMLGVDSLQTVRCAAEATAARELSDVAAVTARVHAIRDVATRHQLIAIATSEMGRGAYRSGDPTQQTSTLAASKWSGAVEYSARVLLGLKSVPGETDLIELEIAKNKHGPRAERLHLRIDRGSQTLTSSSYEPPPADEQNVHQTDRARQRIVSDAVTVVRLLEASPGMGVRELRAAARADSGAGHERVTDAIALLADAVLIGRGPNRSQPMTIDRTKLPDSVRALLERAS
jgi:replicative DNA helicase